MPQTLSRERVRMKYCPYCGATLMGGAVSYCKECGNDIKSLDHNVPVETGVTKKTKRVTRKPKKKPRKPGKGQTPEPYDDGYDGYYDDVKPIDSGHIHDRTDPELIKRIIIVSAGAAVIVILSVLIMYLL